MSEFGRTSSGAARSLPRVAESAVERARLSVVPRARVQAARVPFVTLVSVLLLGGVVGLLFFNTSMQQSSFTVSSLQDQADVLSAREQALAMEIQRLQDPQAIARRAQRLGMAIPEAPLFLDLRTGRVVGDREAASISTRVALDPAPPVLPAELAPRPRVKIVPPPEGVLPEDRADTADTASGRGASDEKKNDGKKNEKKNDGSARGGRR
ncbi:hypothetical protein GCM10022215_01890 [Nocardioides fonticola]|uniref:Cell division protein FtsL n=1 Tax=Nocardioides fonticola TaxID=450363 RepID=A0ABP7X9G6_9ACTN